MRRAGFTLFELLIVLAILSLSAFIVIPQLENETEDNLDAAILVVHNALAQARGVAKLSRKNTLLEFFPTYIRIAEKKRLEFPSSVQFKALVFPDNRTEENTLRINQRGIAPFSIVRMETQSGVYSVLINPVLSELEVLPGVKVFTNFIE